MLHYGGNLQKRPQKASNRYCFWPSRKTVDICWGTRLSVCFCWELYQTKMDMVRTNIRSCKITLKTFRTSHSELLGVLTWASSPPMSSFVIDGPNHSAVNVLVAVTLRRYRSNGIIRNMTLMPWCLVVYLSSNRVSLPVPKSLDRSLRYFDDSSGRTSVSPFCGCTILGTSILRKTSRL